MKRRSKEYRVNPVTGQRIRTYREALGISQEDLARRADSTKGTISRIELGKQMPQTALILSLVEEFDVSADYLLGLSDEPRGKVTLGNFSDKERIVFEAFLNDPDTLDRFAERLAERLAESQRLHNKGDSI